MILKPETLDFWSGFVPGKGLELRDLVTLVPPRFGQLTVSEAPLGGGGGGWWRQWRRRLIHLTLQPSPLTTTRNAPHTCIRHSL